MSQAKPKEATMKSLTLVNVTAYLLVIVGIAGIGLPATAAEGKANRMEPMFSIVQDRTLDIPEPPSGKVALRFSIVYSPTSLPGEGLQFYETTDEVNSLWAQESLEEGEELPIGKRLKDDLIFLKPGESRMLAVAYRNPTDEKIGFVTLPHQDSPNSIGHHTKLTCFCMSMVYKVPAKGSWYRVVRMGVSPDIPVGSKLDALFTILTDPKTFLPAK